MAKKIQILVEMKNLEEKFEIVTKIMEEKKGKMLKEKMKILEDVEKIEAEILEMDEAPPSKMQKMLEIGAVVGFGAVYGQMPPEIQMGIMAAGAAGYALKMSSDSKTKQLQQKKQIKMQQLHTFKMQEISKNENELLMEMIKEIQDVKILAGQIALKMSGLEFSLTYPAGSQIRSQMKQVEKLGYIEIRMMLLTLDQWECRRRLEQEVQAQTDLKKLTSAAKKIAEEFISARYRFKDVPKVLGETHRALCIYI